MWFFAFIAYFNCNLSLVFGNFFHLDFLKDILHFILPRANFIQIFYLGEELVWLQMQAVRRKIVTVMVEGGDLLDEWINVLQDAFDKLTDSPTKTYEREMRTVSTKMNLNIKDETVGLKVRSFILTSWIYEIFWHIMRNYLDWYNSKWWFYVQNNSEHSYRRFHVIYI